MGGGGGGGGGGTARGGGGTARGGSPLNSSRATPRSGAGSARGYRPADPIAGLAAERARMASVSLDASRVAAARQAALTPSLRSSRRESGGGGVTDRGGLRSSRSSTGRTPRDPAPRSRRELAEGLMSGSATARAALQRSASAGTPTGAATARAARRAALPF